MKLTQELFNAAWSNKPFRLPNERTDDIERIRDIAMSRLDIELTSEQAEKIWQMYSDELDAQWITPRESVDVQQAIELFIQKRHEQMAMT